MVDIATVLTEGNPEEEIGLNPEGDTLRRPWCTHAIQPE